MVKARVRNYFHSGGNERERCNEGEVHRVRFDRQFRSRRRVRVLRNSLVELMTTKALRFDLFRANLRLGRVHLTSVTVVMLILRRFNRLLGGLRVLTRHFVRFFLYNYSPVANFDDVSGVVHYRVRQLVHRLNLCLKDLMVIVSTSANVGEL